MKIFGHYFFEDSPELKAYKIKISKRNYEEMVRACEADDKGGNPETPVLTEIPWGDLLWGDQAKHDLGIHKRFEKRGECHKFNGKKYCYHKSNN